MEKTGGKWVPLEEFSRKKGISKATAYKLIHNGELIKRFVEGAIEVFVAGDDAILFDNIDSKPLKESDLMDMHIDLPEGDDYGIAAKSLRTLMEMHKEVLAEKLRLLSEWEIELGRREERLVELEAALSERDKKINEKNIEIRQLRSAVLKAEQTSQRLEHDLEEVRNSLMQFNELNEGSQQNWDRLNKLLDEKDHLIEAKEEIIKGTQLAVGQNEMAMRESERVIVEFKRSLEKTRALLKEKEQIVKMFEVEPNDLDGKLAARDQRISELNALVTTLEQQLESAAGTIELTGFEQDPDAVTSLIQDQLEYLMTSQDVHEKMDEENAGPPSAENEPTESGPGK